MREQLHLKVTKYGCGIGRCGTSRRVRDAVHLAFGMMEENEERIASMSARGVDTGRVTISDLSPFIHIGTDESVIVVVNHSEMGQGVDGGAVETIA